jgi:hypothetical protein
MTDFTASRFIPRPLATLLAGGAVSLVCFTTPLVAQVLVVGPGSENSRYATIQPTNIALSTDRLTGKTKQELIRVLDAEQGFAMRPIPKGGHGLVIHANGPLDPNGKDYMHAIADKGVSIKPGERVLITDVKIEKDKIVFELNGGPDHKHKWLRHVSVGASPDATNPIVQDDADPTGSRLTLLFKGDVPEMTGTQVKALIGPVIDFNFKTPVQAFVDTLPPQLHNAIMNHQVLVGMSTEMVIYALGKPEHKSREIEGQMPYEEWIYGEPPQDVEFVRINGNRVIRVEIAKVGQDPVIRDQNEVEGTVEAREIHTIKLGDEQPDPDTAQKAPPTLRAPGEVPPPDDTHGPSQVDGAMGPVQFPKGIDKGKTQDPPPPPPQAAPQTNPPSNYVPSTPFRERAPTCVE